MAGVHGSPLLEADDLYVGPREPGAPISYWDGTRTELAKVHATDPSLVAQISDEVVRAVAESWEVVDGGGVVFRLQRYQPAEHSSYVVAGPDGDPIATFLCEGGLLHEHVVVRDDATAPVADIETHHHRHELRELGGEPLASCRRVLDAAGNDPSGEIWHLGIEADNDEVLDRRALVAAPLVCHLIGHPKRHVDPECAIAIVLLYVAPPVGLLAIGIERTIDGLYWLRRKLD